MSKNSDWRTFVSWIIPAGIMIGLSYFFILTVAGNFALVPQFLRTVGSLTAFLMMFILGSLLIGVYEYSKSWIKSDEWKKLFYLHDTEEGYLGGMFKNWYRLMIGGLLFFIPFMYFAAVNNRFFTSIPMRGQSALETSNILHNTIFPAFTENIWAGFTLGILLLVSYWIIENENKNVWYYANIFLVATFVFDYFLTNEINLTILIGSLVAMLAANILYFTGNKDALYVFFSLVVVPYVNGRYVWRPYHNFAYGNDEVGAASVTIFGIVGSLLVVVTGSAILWIEWHLMNNMFLAMKFAGVLASGFTLPIFMFIWLGLAFLLYQSYQSPKLNAIGG